MLAKAARSRQGLICADCGTPVDSWTGPDGPKPRPGRVITMLLLALGSCVIFSLVMLNELREPSLNGEPATSEQPARGE